MSALSFYDILVIFSFCIPLLLSKVSKLLETIKTKKSEDFEYNKLLPLQKTWDKRTKGS